MQTSDITRYPYAAVLGRNRLLSLAELRALGGLDGRTFMVEPAGMQAALLGRGFTPETARQLGGSTKVVRIAGVASSPEEAIQALTADVTRSTKFSFGVSVYGRADAGRLARQAKRALKQNNASVRYVPTERQAKSLSTAQVLHNGLLKDGYEWGLIEHGRREWHYGRTVWIQDLEAFGKRDYDKPSNDPRRGMLPPKLARTMLNLSGLPAGKSIYDPFCGSGVVLMEARLLGLTPFGSDISPKAVSDTKRNLQWLAQEYDVSRSAKLEVADASAPLPFKSDAIVTEGYLGHPVRENTSFPEILNEQRQVESLVTQFLKRAHAALPIGGRLVLTVPLWRLPHSGDRRIRAIDGAARLGYTKVRCVPDGLSGPELTERESLLVSRPKQRVVHELYVLEKRGEPVQN